MAIDRGLLGKAINIINNVGQYGPLDATIDSYKQAADYADDARQYYEQVGALIDSSDPSGLVNLLSTDTGKGDSLIGVKQSYVNSTSRTQHEKNSEIFSPGDFNSQDDLINALIGSANSVEVINTSDMFTLTVGEGGKYANIKDALEGAVRLRPHFKYGNSFCEIKLLSGFVLSEQLTFGGNYDFSWIKITSEDSVVYSDTSSFSETVRTWYQYKYMFYFHENSKSPAFAIQIEENRSNSDVCAFVVTEGSQLNLIPYSGARKFNVGIHATFGSRVLAQHTGSATDPATIALYKPAGYYVCDFSDSITCSVSIFSGSSIHMPASKFDRCPGSNGSVFVIYNSIGYFQGSSAKNCYIGWNIRDGSIVNMRDHTTTNCTLRGLTTIHSVVVDARNHDTEETLVATSGQVLNPQTQNGFYGCAVGVRVDGSGLIDVAGNDMRNCGTCINADTGGIISGKAVDISNATLAFDCVNGGSVNFPRLWGTNIQKLMHLQDGSSFCSNIFHVSGSTPTSDIRWIDVERSNATFFNGSIDANSGVIADCGSSITLEGTSTTSPLTTKVQSIRSFYGSRVAINNATADKTYSISASATQLIISGGSFIAATGYLNQDASNMTISTARNVLSAAGAIFHLNGVVPS